MFELSLKDTGALLGRIEDSDLELLMDQLEEESEEDTDYYVNLDTIEMLEESGASARLLKILRDAVGDSDGIEIVWRKA